MTGKVQPKKEDPARYSPPENFKKRMAVLEERESKMQGHAAPKGGGSHHKVHAGGMAPADVEIQQRLEKLKEKTPQEVAAGKVTASEIEDRLARMKGMDPTKFSSSNKPVYHPPDRRTQQEQMNDLLDEISNEVELDSKLPDPVTEIATRLGLLKCGTIECNTTADDNENNLNKPSLRGSTQFSHNISTVSSQQQPSPKLDKKNSKNGEGSTMEQKPSNSDHEDAVSPEEVSRILIEAAKELEDDALNAMQGLQQDKEIMKKIKEIKQRRKESAADINKDEDIDKSDSDNEDDDKLAEDIILQALEESKLDVAAAKDGIKINPTDVTNAHTKKMNTDGNDE